MVTKQQKEILERLKNMRIEINSLANEMEKTAFSKEQMILIENLTDSIQNTARGLYRRPLEISGLKNKNFDFLSDLYKFSKEVIPSEYFDDYNKRLKYLEEKYF